MGLVAILLVATSGAVVALGDTLFPARTLAEGVRQDFAVGAHLFLRLRVIHPALAVASAIYLLLVTAMIASRDPAATLRRPATVTAGLVCVQVAVGFANLLLLAPVALQIAHLLLADLVWLSLVVLTAAAREQGAAVGAGQPGSFRAPRSCPAAPPGDRAAHRRCSGQWVFFSIASSRLYLASRSERRMPPTWRCSAPQPTARSVSQSSSVSPVRPATITVHSAFRAARSASAAALRVPHWLGLRIRVLQAWWVTACWIRALLVQSSSSPASLTCCPPGFLSWAASAVQPSQSSSPSGSSTAKTG